jgi:hypothetical protein
MYYYLVIIKNNDLGGMVEKNINNRNTYNPNIAPDEPCQEFPARLMVTIQPN